MVGFSDRINGLVGGIAFKAPCRAATTANIALDGEQTIDGVSIVDGDRVLVKEQTSSMDKSSRLQRKKRYCKRNVS